MRYGGEEFALIMPLTELLEGVQGCERIWTAIEHYPWSELHEELKRVTVSVGLSSSQQALNIESQMKLADDYLYKGQGSW
ncbi:MAG: diguanylate cyclase [Deinococcales bacterium]